MKKSAFYIIPIFLMVLIYNHETLAQKNRIIVPAVTTYLDANSSPYNKVRPGDTLFFEGGNKEYLQLKNFLGSKEKPIVFVNVDGVVTINTDFYYGIKIANCRYIRLTGTGDIKHFYGFVISRVKGGAGMSVGDLSSDFEIDHISISNCPIAGVYAKTDPDCSRTSLRENFTQYNTVFHNNYISNTGNEGMYIGSSFYSGETIDCDGQRINVFPSLLSGVKVYNNIVKYTGWDGIQIGSASTDCEIMNNLVMYDSQAGVDFQMSGILIGGGSQCDCYNNYIYRGKGDAVESLGLGNYKVYNNVIIDPGYNYYPDDPSKMKYGIYVNDVSCITGNSFSILFNDIINPKTNGIRFSSTRSKKNLIASNVIINPGKGSTGYIVLTSPSCDVLQKNNYLSMTKKAAGFADTTYSLLITSPLKINSFPFTDPPGSKLTITYTIDSIRDVSMDVYNLNGEQVSHFNQTKMSSGTHNFKLDITSFPDGVVLYTIRAGKEALSGKFVKVK